MAYTPEFVYTLVAGGGDFNCMAASDTTIVVVGASGKIYTSPTGETWTPRTSGTTQILNGVAYGNGRFIACGYTGTILTSDDDGVTWVDRSTGTATNYKIAYGNGVWIIGRDNSDIVRSTDDGVTWSSVIKAISLGTGSILKVFWTGINFIALNASKYIGVSASGNDATWVKKEISGSIYLIHGDSNGDGIAVIVDTVYRKIFTSQDHGTSWSISYTYSGTPNIMSAVCAFNEFFYAGEAGGYVFASIDGGENWISESLPRSDLYDVRNGINKNNRIVFCANGGYIIYKDVPDVNDSGTVLLLDSCQRYDTAIHIGYQYPTKSNATISRSYYRIRQTRSIALASGGYIQRDFNTDYVTLIMGAAVYLTGYPASDQLLFQMLDGASEAIGLYISSTGMPKIKNGSTSFVIGTTAIETGCFVYVELKLVIDNTTGMVQVWIYNPEETYIALASDQDTLRTVNGIVDNIRWCGPGAGNTYVTSLYCLAWEFPQTNASPFGNIEIHAYRPIQDASNVGCLPNTGTTLTPTVEEITPVLDDYIYLTATDSPPDQYRLMHDPFVFPNPETTQEILAVQIVGLLANGNADSPPVDADFSFFWGYGSETGNSDPQTVTADDAWLYYSQGYIENPATEAAWANEAELNAFTWGVAHE